MTDYWSSQERMIVSGFELGFITASGSIDEGDILKFSTTAATDTQVDGVITMEEAVALGDGVGVALKTTSSGDIMPVLFYGVHKFTVAGADSATDHQIYAGSLVVNSTSDTYVVGTRNCGIGTGTGSAAAEFLLGDSHIFGMAMQYGDNGDEILVLVGRSI